MADQVMTSSAHLSAIVPEVWSQRWFDVLLASLPFNDSISRDYEGEIKDLGDTVNISSFPEFSDATELAEDARADADAITVSGQQLVINNRVVKDFIVTKKAMLQSLPHMDKLRELAIYALMKKMQSMIIAAIVPNAAAPDHSIAYDAGTTLALADILEAKELLDAQDVPMDGRAGIVGSAQLNDIFNISGFTSSDFLLGNAAGGLQSGQIPPSLLGFAMKFTTEVGNTSYWFHNSFLTLAVQEGVNINQYDLGVDGKRAVRVNLDVLFGLKQLDGLRVVSIS